MNILDEVWERSSVRLSYAKEGTELKVLDTNDYYPFGMNHLSSSMGGGSTFNPQASPLNYKYNGKEMQESGMYDYGARMYMSDIGRWSVIDPLAEQMSSHSVYNYGFNNPIRFIDPDGRKAAEPMQWEDQNPRLSSSGGRMYDYMVSQNVLNLNAWMPTFNTGGGGGGGRRSTLTLDNNESYEKQNKNGVSEILLPTITLTSTNWRKQIFEHFLASIAEFNAKQDALERNFIAQQNIDKARTRLYTAISSTNVGQSVAGVENFLFRDMPVFLAGGSAASGLFRFSSAYLREAAIRGATDAATQALFKNGEIDMKQLFINTYVGGGSTYQVMAKIAGINLGLNTLNNIYSTRNTSLQSIPLNIGKIVTGVLGAGIGIVGGDILGSLYGNGMDAYLQREYDKTK